MINLPELPVWVWCLHCERAFYWDKPSFECKYDDCNGYIIDFCLWPEFNEMHGNIHPAIPTEGVIYPT
jgi:hypothetical protein